MPRVAGYVALDIIPAEGVMPREAGYVALDTIPAEGVMPGAAGYSPLIVFKRGILQSAPLITVCVPRNSGTIYALVTKSEAGA